MVSDAFCLRRFRAAIPKSLWWLSVWRLPWRSPEKITSVCDRVRDELNRLRMNEDKSLTDDVQLGRVEAVEHYVQAVNLGFHILGVRISYKFMCVDACKRYHIFVLTRLVLFCMWCCVLTLQLSLLKADPYETRYVGERGARLDRLRKF